MTEGMGTWARIRKAAPSAAALLIVEKRVCPKSSRESEGSRLSGGMGLGQQHLHCCWFLLEVLPLNGPSAEAGAVQPRSSKALTPADRPSPTAADFVCCPMALFLFPHLWPQCLHHEHVMGHQTGARYTNHSWRGKVLCTTAQTMVCPPVSMGPAGTAEGPWRLLPLKVFTR